MRLDGLTHWPGFIGCCNPLFVGLDGLLAGLHLRFKNRLTSIKYAFLNKTKTSKTPKRPDLYIHLLFYEHQLNRTNEKLLIIIVIIFVCASVYTPSIRAPR